MNFDFDDGQQEIRRTARDLLTARSTLARVRELAEEGADDAALAAELADLGWPGIAIAEEDGGLGLGMVELCVLLEQTGSTLAAVPLLSTAVAAAAIGELGDDAQRARWLPGLASGEIRGALGVVAPGEESAIVPDGVGAEVIVLLGPDGEGRVVTGAEPVELIDPTRRYARVAATGEGEVLAGDGSIDRALALATLALSAELLGVARRALDLTLSYVKDRRQFGVPVGSFQAVAHKCALMLRQVETAQSVVYAAAWAADAGRDDLDTQVAQAKVIASEAARDVTAAAVQAHGGIGFTWEADVHWLLKRAQVGAQLYGTPGACRARLRDAIVSGRSLVAA